MLSLQETSWTSHLIFTQFFPNSDILHELSVIPLYLEYMCMNVVEY